MKWTLIFLLLMPAFAFAEGESLGTFRFSEFSLSPRAALEEPSSGGFELQESFIGFQWIRDESTSGELSVGSADLIQPAIWYPEKTETLALVAASLQAKTPYFNFRAGLLPIPTGFEGSFPEWERQLPETRARAHRWFTQRDFGMELKSELKPYLTTLTIHNGESGTNFDQKLWATGQWRWIASDGFGVLGTAQVGRTDARSSTASPAALAEGFVFDNTQEAKFRHGSIAVFRKWNRNLLLYEIGEGEILQLDQKHPFGWQHLDLCANLGGDLSLLFRIEHDQADENNTATLTRSYGAGFSVTSKDRLSSVMLWTQKNQEENELPNDQLLLQFRLNSNSL